MSPRVYRVMLPALSAAAVLALAGCDPEDVAAGGGSSAPQAGGRPAGGFGASPLDNSDGTKPGLAPLTTDADRSAARRIIEKVATKGRGPKTGYERDKFGYAWKDSVDGVPLSHNGCDTRNDLLARDGKDVELRSGSDCVVVSMTLADPYTGSTIEWRKQQATKVQIDHVMPLSYDWQMGAAHWPDAKRQQIANDPLNLIPVDGPANNAKRDSGPASWLPPSKQIRCSYAVRFAQVSLKYALPVTAADKRAMLTQCGG
ncbi:HNH endonuclease family protein [Streptomyces sp. NPDC058231]|uniref:HNH endonuclease family protein n=1 Tax=Streptomyces sp. NPDC058231 TaxID=3346392 RepID=UPI0036E9C231